MTEQQKPEHYQALTKEDYQKLIFDSPLNIGLKTLFSPIHSTNEYKILAQYIFDARNELFNLAKSMREKARQHPMKHVPLFFVVDYQNSSGGKFLRWRNQDQKRNGKPAWEQIVSNKDIPIEIRRSLVALEKDRIAFNAQMSVLNFILRQARECEEKINEVDSLFQEEL
ncbi:DUF3158 family protein [Gallibacterium anatis]|uniref:DUF3158 family protein n=3 Tax=Gallibacterium anatis TaxID=750 RepID=U1I6R3_9PAST|nr:DUF3158 family protein [Gallibacterium anatis]ERF77909.1 hypothetical protein N561_09030 [Gallibacterium anatis 12656/12]KGQ64086.1 hypothetical protein IO48_00310 [Gallibacterium anatis 4895]HJF74149.1 DUF3158 family protein [Gallibacterium anatis]